MVWSMPELPEVEVLVRHLDPLITGRTIRNVVVNRAKVLEPTSEATFKRVLEGQKIFAVQRRGKYLLFRLRDRAGKRTTLLGHLGMTGRMYLLPSRAELPKHAAVVFGLGREQFVFEDTRYFGRLTLDTSAVELLGPEPLGPEFTPETLLSALKRSSQPVKVKLLDQSLIAGIGNIYASEALFRAGLSPRRKAWRITKVEAERLHGGIRNVLEQAIEAGSTIPLDFAGKKKADSLLYYGTREAHGNYEERLLVYDRHGKPCNKCGKPVVRFVQAARSTFYCKQCQK
jgi:formamidopyrimidine-DNA glycosylase